MSSSLSSNRRNASATATKSTTASISSSSSKYRNPLYILYGSATGNSENIAKDLTKLIVKHNNSINNTTSSSSSDKSHIQEQLMHQHNGGGNHNNHNHHNNPYQLSPVFDGVICCELDQYKKMGALQLWESSLLLDNESNEEEGGVGVGVGVGVDVGKTQLQYQYRGVIIVCSTTGNGDAPENACRFVRHIKKAATNKDTKSLLFQNVCYTILGLGDTNYDQYCAAAITIDRYIHLLGGQRMVSSTSSSNNKHLICADEGSGQLEDVVDPWMKTIVQDIVHACSRNQLQMTKINGNNIQHPVAQEEKVNDAAVIETIKSSNDNDTANTVQSTTTGIEPVPIPTNTTTTLSSTSSSSSTTTVTPNNTLVDASLGVQMVQSLLQSTTTTTTTTTTADYCTIQTIDPSLLPSFVPITEEEDGVSVLLNSTNKPFTFVQDNTINEGKVLDLSLNTLATTTTNVVQQRLRGLSIGSETTTSGNNPTMNIIDDTASSVSAGYYYNYNNPYISQIIQARYLTHQTTTTAAQQVTDRLVTAASSSSSSLLLNNNDRNSKVWTPSLYKDAESIYDTTFPLQSSDIVSSSKESVNDNKVVYDKNSKRVIEMSLSIPDDTSLLEYAPGDSLGLIVDNPQPLVEYIIQLLQQNDPTVTNPYEQMIVLHHHDGSHNKTKTPITIVDAISRYLDLSSVVKNKRILYALSLVATDPIESYYLQLLSSKVDVGIQLYNTIIDEQRYNIVDIIQYLFPSIQSNITLEILFTLIPNTNIAPRYYSVSSSPLQSQYTTNGNSKHHYLTIAFSVVDYVTPSLIVNNKDIGQRRIRGTATRYLETISSSLLCTSPKTTSKESPVSSIPTSTVRIFPKPTMEFRMPQSLLTPLILIGPGTGIAPFIGFLRHRQILYRRQQAQHNSLSNGDDHHHSAAQTIVEGTWRGGYELSSDGATNELGISQQDESGLNIGADYRIQHPSTSSSSMSNTYGPVDVFFGCRYKDHDWLYKDEMNEFVKEGIISNLYTAFSRETTNDVSNNGDTRRNKYVQDIMLYNTECSKRMMDMILQQNAIVYVCGDGNVMGQDVQTAIISLLAQYQYSNNIEHAKLYLDEMKHQQRFLMDIWS